MSQDKARQNAVNRFFANGGKVDKLSKEDQHHLRETAKKESGERGNKVRTALYGRHDKHG